MNLSNKALALTLETQLSITLDHISKLRKQLVSTDMRDQVGNEPWFSSAGHPLLSAKELAYRLLSQSNILAQDINYIIENGSI